MLKNYFTIAWRNLLKNRLHSVLNLFGLSVGLGFTFLIASYVWSEWKVNRGLRNVKNQYIIQSNWKDPNMGYNLTTVGPLARALKEQYPGLVSNFYRWDGITSNISKGDRVFREGLQVGDSTLLNMFGFELLHGDKRTALNDPFTVVITENKAVKYFGKTDVVGQTISIESFSGSKHDFKITGVMKTPSYNSVLSVLPAINNEFFIPLVSLSFFGRDLENWNNAYIVGLVELREGVKPDDLDKPMQSLLEKNSNSQIVANMRPHLIPLTGYHLYKENGLIRKMLYTVSFIALFILVMAMVNFINVSIAKSSTRIKEIGVRKVIGGTRSQLIQQYLVESVLTVLFATAISILIYYLANPYLSAVFGKSIPKLSQLPISFAVIPLLLALIIGITAGIYPALVLSALEVVDSVKGKLKSVRANISLRKALVGFQFFTASIVLVGSVIASQQVNYFFEKDLGYEKEFVVSAQVPRNWSGEGVKRMITIRNEFAAMPEVVSVSLCYGVASGASSGHVPMYVRGKDSTQAISLEQLTTDENYLQTFRIPVVAGRFFQNATDSKGLVINETAARAFGWNHPGQAIGKQLYFPGNQPENIIGVTKDFHFNSMKEVIRPLMFTHVNLTNTYRFLTFKLKPGNISSTLEALQNQWTKLMPGTAFEHSFMDDTLAKMYESEIQLKKASQAATVLALVIVILGVLGLVSLSIQKKTREIGIRKVLGASVTDIASMFLGDFLPAILIGGIISVPVAWYVMQQWLNDYSYKISITPEPFVVAVLVLGLITSLIILLQITKATKGNPVKNLRTE